ncbi:hypothetical protein LNQ81_08420 [Myroides sp. M-43]|uniref:hypothetical protein n=1 Tax=Myroides oncorhynchi TaxID=2893756 RepID=UPI001E59BF20|nr:hypothetical protein [Myroides oncorhynchi]MCC9042714.1 hypothetical protein [Myroides oncorhynchi]
MDFKLLISIYAAIISTVVFAWRLYEFYYDRVGKLKVSMTTTSRTFVFGNGMLGKTELFLEVCVVNIGKNKRFIEQPSFQSNENFEGKKYLNLLRTDVIKKFPICLEPGEKFVYDLPYDDLEKELKKAGVSKLRGRVYDTHRKVYRSKWFKL